MRIGAYKVNAVTKGSVKVGCTLVTREQVERVLALMRRSKVPVFHKGDKVKVVRWLDRDDKAVLGLQGTIVRAKDGICVKFPGWHAGHAGPYKPGRSRSCWWVNAGALRKVRKNGRS
jgi:hypothetical protein